MVHLMRFSLLFRRLAVLDITESSSPHSFMLFFETKVVHVQALALCSECFFPARNKTTPRFLKTKIVLVQPEMERGRSPLVSNSTLQVGICKASIWTTRLSPQHGCVPAEPASVSPGKMIVAPPCPSVPTVGAGCIRFESFVQLPFT